MNKIFTSVLIIATLFFFGPVPRAYAAAPTDYVSCWDFDESSTGVGAVTRLDANTTNSNDLTDNNTTASAAGKISNAADFERGNSEFLSITDANQVGLDGITDWSFFEWVKYESTPTSGQLYGYVGKRNTGDAATYAFETFNHNSAGTQKFRVDLYNGTTEETANADWTPTAGTWYHIGWTFQGSSKEMKFYVNGVQQGATVTFTSNSSIRNSTGDFTIAQANSDGHYFDGLMDIAEYYNRVLTGTEITDIYNAGTGVACTGRSAGGGSAPVYSQPPILFE